MPPGADFDIEVDAAAAALLRSRTSNGPKVIKYDVHRCCGGGKICTVDVLDAARRDDVGSFVAAVLPDGTKLAIDPRAAERLPSRFRLTARGFGRFRHLDLDLTGEQWGALLYG